MARPKSHPAPASVTSDETRPALETRTLDVGLHSKRGMPLGRSSALCSIGLLVAVASGCGSLPRDPKKTLEGVRQQKHVKVGLVENPPWVVRAGSEPEGAEVRLVREFAESLGATPEWFWGGEQENLEALERFELDVVVGGLDAATPWMKKIGLTRPYFIEPILVGIPGDAHPPESLKGIRVAVKGGEAAAAHLLQKHATPVRVSDLQHLYEPVAAPDWRLRQLGLMLTKFELDRKKHVMAVPPGENEWLKRLQEFVDSRQGEIAGLLQDAEAIQ
jgi:polar amino acid transport system substrate-binding protein